METTTDPPTGSNRSLLMSGLKAELDRGDRNDPVELGAALDSTLPNGSDSAAMGENVARNLQESRIVPAIGVFEPI